jgi:hypothetical protein
VRRERRQKEGYIKKKYDLSRQKTIARPERINPKTITRQTQDKRQKKTIRDKIMARPKDKTRQQIHET